MTEFPELLNKFIEQKNIHIYSMAKYCGLDRSTLYKIIKGNRRPPSASVRDKMACFMHLTPDETRQFDRPGRFLLQESSLTAGGKALKIFF